MTQKMRIQLVWISTREKPGSSWPEVMFSPVLALESKQRNWGLFRVPCFEVKSHSCFRWSNSTKEHSRRGWIGHHRAAGSIQTKRRKEKKITLPPSTSKRSSLPPEEVLFLEQTADFWPMILWMIHFMSENASEDRQAAQFPVSDPLPTQASHQLSSQGARLLEMFMTQNWWNRMYQDHVFFIFFLMCSSWENLRRLIGLMGFFRFKQLPPCKNVPCVFSKMLEIRSSGKADHRFARWNFRFEASSSIEMSGFLSQLEWGEKNTQPENL